MMLNIRLKELRQEKKISQKDLAEIIGVPQSSIGFFESGDRVPNLRNLEKLAKYFNVSTDYLLGISNIRAKAEVVKVKSMAKYFKDPFVMEIMEDVQELSDEGKEEVMKYIEYIQSKNQKKGEDK